MWLTCKLSGFLVGAVLFYDRRDHFKKKLLLWSQVPFKYLHAARQCWRQMFHLDFSARVHEIYCGGSNQTDKQKPSKKLRVDSCWSIFQTELFISHRAAFKILSSKYWDFWRGLKKKNSRMLSLFMNTYINMISDDTPCLKTVFEFYAKYAPFQPDR